MDRAEVIAELRRLGRRRSRQQATLDVTTAELHALMLQAIDNGMTVADVARFTGYHRNNVSRIHNARDHD